MSSIAEGERACQLQKEEGLTGSFLSKKVMDSMRMDIDKILQFEER